MSKVTITINSRQYTVVAEESEEYIQALGDHINEKINNVLESGANVMGERPLILAALNICDEYFKVNEAGYTVNEQLKVCTAKLNTQIDENNNLREQIKNLQADLVELKSGQVTIDETETKATTEMLSKQLMEAEEKIKFLEGQIRLMENKQKDMKQEFAAREQEILDMIEK